MMWYYGWGGWDWLWMVGMMLLFWSGVILLAIWAIRSFNGPREAGDAALDVLRRRLAAGEITPDEFEKTKKALGA
jgi:putative membrane protein